MEPRSDIVSPRRWLRRGWQAVARGDRREIPSIARLASDAASDRIPPVPHVAGPRAVDGAGKKILFINQYYWPDHASTAQHLADLAEDLAARGYECHVLCARGRYQPGEPNPPAFEVHKGVRIHRVRATSMGRSRTLARMTDYLSFYSRALLKALELPRFDAVVTLTTPPIIGLVGTLLKRLKGTRHVCWSMDLHPDASLALGRMSPRNPVVRGLYRLSRLVYRKADRVVVLGPYMADRVALAGVGADRIATIPVWSRREEVYPIPRGSNALRRSLGLGDAFVVMYSGNLGLAHTFDEFLEAARRLHDRTEVVFVFAGAGPRLGEVKAARERHGLANVRLLDYVPRSHLHMSLSMADVHLISMRPEMTGIVVPGKLYGIMAAGRPAVFVGPRHCESADTIRTAGGGITVERGDVEGLVAALTHLAADPSLVRRMGERGRSAFLAEFERRHCCEAWHNLVAAITSAGAPALASARRAEAAAIATPPVAANRLWSHVDSRDRVS
jgi:glycosyltransferase involved in cell wall biosynthesis